MVIWITGKAKAGKTTTAYKLKATLEAAGKKAFVLDGDEVRDTMALLPYGGYETNKRFTHQLTMSCMAALAEDQGLIPIIACVSPSRRIRKMCRTLFRESHMVYVEGGYMWEGTNYEEPDGAELAGGRKIRGNIMEGQHEV